MKVQVGDLVRFELPNRLRVERDGDLFALPPRPRTLQFIVTPEMLAQVLAPRRRRARHRRQGRA